MIKTLPIDKTLLADETLLELGHAALVEALGAQGAMQFLAIQSSTEEVSPAAGGFKRVGVQVGLPASGTSVVLRLSRPVSWMKLSPGESRGLAQKLLEGTTALEERNGRAIAHRDTGAN